MKPASAIGEGALVNLAEIAATAPEGCFVEVGVYKGGSAAWLAEVARQQGRQLYLYDTFAGIPYAGPLDQHVVGDFGDTSAEAVRAALPDAVVIEGVFPNSLVRMPPVAFAHIDCDQYEAVKAACLALTPLMVSGGIMVFDDYGCLPGATQAVDEYFPTIELTRHHKALVRINGLAR